MIRIVGLVLYTGLQDRRRKGRAPRVLLRIKAVPQRERRGRKSLRLPPALCAASEDQPRIAIFRGSVPGFFATSMRSTPSLNDASMRSKSTSSGSETLRVKTP